MIEKFNKNAKVEKFTNLLGIATRLIVIDPLVLVVSTKEHLQIPNGTGPGVRRSKRPLLACRTRCKCSRKPLAIR